MTDKFTIRDILVYTFLGFTAVFFYYLHDKCFIVNIIEKSKDYSSLWVVIIIPIFYLLGHAIMSFDDFIFNAILKRFLPDSLGNSKLIKYYNLIFFGCRNIGLRRQFNISDIVFFDTCDKIISSNKDLYLKAEYYQVMSDLFKGIFLIIFASIVLDCINYIFVYWKIILLCMIWYRARSFSSYYVRIIKRNI